jgi:putative spermidine/putrescine transport system substrate-binding protein
MTNQRLDNERTLRLKSPGRRRFLRNVAAAAVTGAVIQRVSIVHAESKELVICTFGGQTFQAHRKAYFEPFEKETGIKIIDASPTDFAKLRAMVMSKNPEWDLVDAGNRHMYAATKAGLLDPIDYKTVNASEFLPGTANEFGLGAFYFSTNICYRGGLPKAPTNWKEFYDEAAFPGTRSLRNSSFENMEFALMSEGVSISEVYPLTEEKIRLAYRALDKIKPRVLKWWKVEAQATQMLVDREVDYAMTAAGRLAVLKRQGANVGFEWNQGNLNGDSWVIPKGAKNKANAMAFLAWFASNPRRQGEFAQLIPYGPCHKRALEFVPPDAASELCTAPENMKRMLISDAQWWGENFEKMEQRWNSWVMK